MSSAAISRFGGSVLDRLDAKVAVRPGVAPATRLPVDLIDEDPAQPRREFDPARLEQIAASIRMVGVLQPVGVVQAAQGRYLLRWGARRLRASKLAGLSDIPAVLVGAQQVGLEAQVIENQHRASNTDTELAAAITTLTERGMKNAEIATVLALPDPQSLKHYRVLASLDETAPLLAGWVNRANIRAIYEMNAAWQRATSEQRAALASGLERIEELTVTEGRRLIAVHTSSATSAPPAAPSQPAPSEAKTAASVSRSADPDAGRVAKVRAWIADPTRPRPPLSV